MIKQTFVSVCMKQNVKRVEALLRFLPLIPTKRDAKKASMQIQRKFSKNESHKAVLSYTAKETATRTKNTPILSLNKSNMKQIHL